MTKEEMKAQFHALGFTEGDQMKDLGLAREWLVYLTREFNGQFQHLWLTFYEGRFVESVLFVYPKPFQPRAKPPMQSIHAMLYRSVNEVLAAVGQVYKASTKL